jgi:hypothetical protein
MEMGSSAIKRTMLLHGTIITIILGKIFAT